MVEDGTKLLSIPEISTALLVKMNWKFSTLVKYLKRGEKK